MSDIESLQARLIARAAEAPAKLADERARNRADMPLMSAVIDDLTKHFGRLPAGKVWENGRVVVWGKRR